MKKIRKLSFLGILGVVIAVLFLISISFTQAQVKIQKKPVKPPEATWAVQIPTEGDTMLYGDGHGDYIDGDKNIEVTVEKNRLSGPWKKDNDFVTHIRFKISNPTERYVDFEGVPCFSYLDPIDYDFVDPDIGYPCCVFPPPYHWQQDGCNNCAYYTCMRDFMNGVNHPSEYYAFFLIDIHAFDIDITNMGYNAPYKLGDFGHYHDYINMYINYQNQTADPTYHNIICSKSAHLGEDSLHDFNIWITRTGEDTWRIDVGTISKQFFFFVEEYYYDQGEAYSTLYQGGNFYFTFDLIMNPQSSTPPEAPSGLNATASACDRINLTWTDNSTNEDGFEIERDGVTLKTVNTNSYSDTDVSENITYSYRVRAYNNAGNSAYSNTASATTPSCGTEPPDAPSGLTANARGKTKIALNWTDNSNNENEFRIYRRKDEPNFYLIATVGPNTSSYVDNKVSSKTTYFYKVCAYNTKGENCSSPVSATTK